MSNTISSTNMSMPVPVVGTEIGPQWALDVNSCLTILDAHNHTVGYGIQVPSSGLNISSDLTFQSNNAIALRSARFTAQGSPLALGTDLGCLYVSGVDLYFNDENGNQVRMTQSGSVAGSTGSISGLSSPASASYSAGSTTFVWQSAAATSAYMDCSSLLIRNLTASSKAVTLQAPAAMAANYTLTLPTSVASTLILTIDNTGVMTGQYAIDNATITAPGNVLTVGANSIGNSNLQSSSVGTAQLAAGSVTTAKIATGAVVAASIGASAVVTAGIQNGAVTPAKKAALGQQVSTSTGVFSTSSTSFVDVTNASVNITTTGRPVFVGLIPDGTTSASSIQNSAAGQLVTIEFLLDATPIAVFNFGGNLSSLQIPPSVCFTIDTIANASAHNYNVKAKISSGTLTFSYVSLVAYEL